MKQTIVLLNTAHSSLDDRVFYHQAKSLSEKGFHVTIVSTAETMETVKETIHICSCNLNSLSRKEKQQKIVEQLNRLTPNIIICDTPAAVLSSHKYRKKHKAKIIYDITEWYPSANNLKNTKGLKKWIRCLTLILFNLYAGLLANGFIFGERYKSKPFRFFYFWKSYIFLPYFPDLEYIQPTPVRKINDTIRLFYGGNIRPARGLPQLILSVRAAAERKPETAFELHLICNLSTEKDIAYFENLTCNFPPNLTIRQKQLLPFVDFCRYMVDMDLFFDLRTISFESNRSLPIKLFYYLACGRPVVYSKLKSITTFFADIPFGYVVNPSNNEKITDYIVNYIDNPDIYAVHCQKALELSNQKYNWKKIEKDFTDFVQQCAN